MLTKPLAEEDAPLPIWLQVFCRTKKGPAKRGGTWIGQWKGADLVGQLFPFGPRKDQQTLVGRIASYHQSVGKRVHETWPERSSATLAI